MIPQLYSFRKDINIHKSKYTYVHIKNAEKRNKKILDILLE